MRLIKYFFIFLFIPFCFYSCVQDQNHRTLKQKEEVVFDVGFPVDYCISYFSDSKDEYIAFVNFKTYKKIAIHSLSTLKQEKKISIKKITDNELIEGFLVIDSNNIALLSKYTNRIFIIDSTGVLRYEKDYSSYLKEDITLSRDMLYYDGNLSTCVQYTEYKVTDDSGDSKSTTLEEYYEKFIVFPLTFKIHNFFSENDSIQLSKDSIYSRFTKKNGMPIEPTYIVKSNSKTLFYSSYTDSIYVFDCNEKLEKIICVKSDFTSINKKPITIKQYQENPSLMNSNSINNSCIISFFYDSYRDLYYCMVRKNKIDGCFQYSIIVYDNEFNKLNETKIDDGCEFRGHGFVGKKGLYLRKKLEKNIKKETYTIFSYE